jgi:hypothetical protein
MYERIESELKGVQQALYLICAMSIAPSSSETVELGDEPTQIQRIEYATKALLPRLEEEKE